MTLMTGSNAAGKQKRTLVFAFAFMRQMMLMFVGMMSVFFQIATAQAQPVTAGYRDYNYGTTVISTPTGEKPESKLWWNDGYWWGSMWDQVANNRYTIHRLDLASQTWINTGVAIDNRSGSKADALWDGQRLYIASHIFTNSPGSTSSANVARLYRFSYNTGSDTYSLDAGFPVNVNSSRSETLVLDKDSSGQLWVTWIEGRRVKVNTTTGSDLSWGTPFNLPVQGNLTDTDDISSVIAFGGNKIGVMWSNQDDLKTYFAIHLDSDADNVWQPREDALADPNLGGVADDHINLKVFSDTDGQLYAVTKTSLSGSNAALIFLLKRATNGSWTRYLYGRGQDNHTRPILLIDTENRKVYVFAMSNRGSGSKEAIYMKSSDLDNISFPVGLGTPFIESATDLRVNNPTSTKQSVNSTTGLVVLASDKDSRYYFHNSLTLGGSGNTPPVAVNDAATTNEETAVAIGVTANDTDSDGAINISTVAISTAANNGTTSVNTGTGVVTYTPNLNFFGADNFRYTVRDNDGAISNAATVTVTVNDINDAPVAVNDAASTPVNTAVAVNVLANDTDSDGTLNASTVTIGTPAGNGGTSVNPTTGVVTYTPNTDFVGNDSFTYTVGDNDNAISNSATVAITVTSGGGSTTLTFNPTDDAQVKSTSASSNYGAMITIRVRAGSEVYNSYLKFNVTGLSGAVQSAKIRLFVTDDGPDGGSIFTVSNNTQGTSTPWTQSNLTWNNAPTISGTALSSAGTVSLNTWIELDVTSALTGNGVLSFGLKSNSSNSVLYSSKEGSNAPQLVIETAAGALAKFEAHETTTLPQSLKLSANYPNPFTLQTSIAYSLPQATKVRVRIYNTVGREIRTLVDEVQPAGDRHVRWDGRDNAGQKAGSGFYLIRLEADQRRLTRVITLVK